VRTAADTCRRDAEHLFFEGVGPDSTDELLRAIAPRHPVFEILPPI